MRFYLGVFLLITLIVIGFAACDTIDPDRLGIVEGVVTDEKTGDPLKGGRCRLE